MTISGDSSSLKNQKQRISPYVKRSSPVQSTRRVKKLYKSIDGNSGRSGGRIIALNSSKQDLNQRYPVYPDKKLK